MYLDHLALTIALIIINIWRACIPILTSTLAISDEDPQEAERKLYEAVDKIYEEIADITQNGITEVEDNHMFESTAALKANVKKLEYLFNP